MTNNDWNLVFQGKGQSCGEYWVEIDTIRFLCVCHVSVYVFERGSLEGLEYRVIVLASFGNEKFFTFNVYVAV